VEDERAEIGPGRKCPAGSAISAWVQKPGQLWWVANERSEVASFAVVTASAGPGKVLRLSQTVVLAADNVIHFAAPERVLFVDQAVLANMVGALGDQQPQPLANLAAHDSGAGAHEP
jgi:hypothetical protein